MAEAMVVVAAVALSLLVVRYRADIGASVYAAWTGLARFLRL